MSKRLTRVIVLLALASLTIGVAIAGAQGSQNEFKATMKGSSESPKGPASASGTFTVEFKNGQACFKMSVKGLGAFPIAEAIPNTSRIRRWRPAHASSPAARVPIPACSPMSTRTSPRWGCDCADTPGSAQVAGVVDAAHRRELVIMPLDLVDAG